MRPTHRQSPRARRAFTIVEAMVTLGVIALLAGILLWALRGAKGAGADASEGATLTSLRIAAQHFKDRFGFLPPLVDDAQVTATQPGPAGQPRTWTANQLNRSAAPLPNGGEPYSDYTLAWYLVGTLPADFDGVEGLGFTAPLKEQGGTFSKRGAKVDPLFDANRKTQGGIARIGPHPAAGVDPASPAAAAEKVRQVIYDYWSMRGAVAAADPAKFQLPIRYYRWLPTYHANGAQKGQVENWNVPVAVGGAMDSAGNADPDEPPTNPNVRSAEFAVVSAGPNRLFGDEPIADIRAVLKLDPGVSAREARDMARSDNLVEHGR